MPFLCVTHIVLQSTWQQKITAAEREVDAARTLTSQLSTIKDDIEDTRRRLENARTELTSAAFDRKISEKNTNGTNLESRREALNTELRTLSLQADSRAKLDLQRGQMKAKATEIQTTCDYQAYELLLSSDGLV